MKLNNIEHIFFDLDHTLWDFDRNSALTFERIFRKNGIELDLDAFLEIYVPRNLYYWKLYRENRIDKQNLRFRRLDDVFKSLNFEIKAAMIHKLSEDYIAFLTTFNHLFDGAIEILDYLRPNYKLHIITNGFKEVQHGKLNKANIMHYFQTVTNSEMVGAKKPHPKIFSHALQMAKADPSQSLMIGDNYEADIMGAMDLGFDTILFNYHNEIGINGVKTVDNLLEIKHYL